MNTATTAIDSICGMTPHPGPCRCARSRSGYKVLLVFQHCRAKIQAQSAITNPLRLDRVALCVPRPVAPTVTVA